MDSVSNADILSDNKLHVVISHRDPAVKSTYWYTYTYDDGPLGHIHCWAEKKTNKCHISVSQLSQIKTSNASLIIKHLTLGI